MAGRDQEKDLAELRQDIDRLDREMHERLMERGRIIDRLIAVKGSTAATGSAFRPEREASMMRAMARRHEGGLPFDAVESIWRIIISTFTHLQAPFSVHIDLSGEAVAMRDSARYHFGFTVPVIEEAGPATVIDAVATSRGDLGLIAASQPPSAPTEAWWRRLESEDSPKIIAHLPFVDRPGHPASHPVCVIAKSISGEGLGATILYSVPSFSGDASPLPELGGHIVSRLGQDALIAAPREVPVEALAKAVGGHPIVVGSHPSTAAA